MKRIFLNLILLLSAYSICLGQTVVFVGDVHVSDSTTYTYFQKTILTTLAREASDAKACIFLGDLVNESPEWLEPMSKNLALVGAHAVMGNHDFDVRAKAEKSIWTSCFGPDEYTFKVGRTYFVAVNNGRGMYSDKAFEMIRAVPSRSNLVLCQHEPLSDAKNREEMLSLLSSRRGQTLIMSAHLHVCWKKTHTANVRECVAGSACTGWWRGVSAENGIPYCPAQCGSPRNYYVLDLSKGRLDLSFRPIETKSQMRMSIVSSYEASLLKDIPEGTFLVNVFGASENAKVSIQIDSGEAFEAARADCMDPYVATLRDITSKAGYERKDPRRTVFLRWSSPHLWKFDAVRDGMPHKVTVRATDEFGLNVTEVFFY